MGMPVKLSDDLVTLARAEAEASHRSLAAQVEHWARMGQAAEAVLRHGDALALKASGGEARRAFPEEPKRTAVLSLLESVAAAPERSTAVERIRGSRRAVYGTDPEFPGMVVRLDPDGGRTPGRFENRRFVPAA